MEIIFSFLYIFFISILSILILAGILFFYLLNDIKSQYKKIILLKTELSKQEMNILKLSNKIIILMAAVSEHISVIEEQQLVLKNKTKNYSNATKNK